MARSLTTSHAAVAIVMRTYERPLLLRRAIQSVLAQTETDWTLAIVNDGGGPDAVNRVLKEFQSELGARLKLLHLSKRHGMEAASNRAIRATSSDFVVIHDDDDTWSPLFLERTTRFLNSPEGRPFPGVVTLFTRIFERLRNDSVIEESRRVAAFDWNDLILSRAVVRTFPPIAFLFRRSVLEKVGFYREDLPVMGDWDFNLRLLLKEDLAFIKEPLAFHHSRPSDQSTSMANSITNLDLFAKVRMRLQNELLRRDLSVKGGFGMLVQGAEFLRQVEDQARFPKPAAPPPPPGPAPVSSATRLDLSNVTFRSKRKIFGPPIDAARSLIYRMLWVVFNQQSQHNARLQQSISDLAGRVDAMERVPRAAASGKQLGPTPASEPYGRVEPFRSFQEQLELRTRIRHVFGPKSPALERDDVIVLCLIRNGEPYLTPFLEHYRRLGAKHFVFLDNGSSDGTVRKVSGQPDVTVLSSSLPFKTTNTWMRQYLLEEFALDRWAVLVDIDEHFDYPFSNRVPLASLVNYLRANSYTAMLTQMLDMFPGGPVGQEVDWAGDLRKTHCYYDVSDIGSRPYPPNLRNQVDNPSLQFNHGGIRQKVFGISELCLTKHSLIHYTEGVQLLNPHCVSTVRIADITGTVLHYKFVPDFKERVAEAVEKGMYWNDSYEYRRYAEALQNPEPIQLLQPSSRKLNSVNQLVDEGFLLVSDPYREFSAGLS